MHTLVSIFALTTALSTGAIAAPITSAWPAQPHAATVTAAPLSGIYATASTFTDSIEIRDIHGGLVREISRAEIVALLPWMNLDQGSDGPTAMTFTDTGRVLYVAVHDANPAPSGASDAILAFDTQNDTLTQWGRLEFSATDTLTNPISLAFFKAKLLLGIGTVVVEYSVPSFATGTNLLAAGTTPVPITSLTVDRDNGHLYALAGGTIHRATITGTSLSFTSVGTIAGARHLAWSDTFGATSIPSACLYALNGSQLLSIPGSQARGTAAFAPTLTATLPTAPAAPAAMAATAQGTILCTNAAATDASFSLRESADSRLSFDAWVGDEFTQVVNFARSLVTAGNNPGWVIDGDVQLGWTRFHPATPDAAAWTILLLIAQDRVAESTVGQNDPTAQALARQILARYADRAANGIGPGRNADGIFVHWIDPTTGFTQSGWTNEWATMSTMKIVLAASRAVDRWPFDPDIKASARAIIGGVSQWEHYINSTNDAMYLVGTATDANLGSGSTPFHEGLLFVSEVGAYGAAHGPLAYTHWLDRARSPSATYIPGFPVTGVAPNAFLASFTSLYCQLLLPEFRASASWQAHIAALRISHMGWTDDFSPRYLTVFSAGTTASIWGGYHADSLSDHPGDVSTFTSLEALSSGQSTGAASTQDAVAAYNAYRKGARQMFSGGASILYRRSDANRAYQPDSAGLPDVGLGGLGLAEHLVPGLIDQTLALPHRQLSALCDGDFNGDGVVEFFDYLDFADAFSSGGPRADFNLDGGVDFFDYLDFVDVFSSGC